MSTLKVNKLRDTAGSADAITLDPNGGAVLAGVTTVTSVKVGAAVTITESGIEASGIGITCANINGTQIGGRRNMLFNGAMQVAQRGTTGSGSYTTSGYPTADRWRIAASNTDNASYNFSLPSDVPTGQGFTRSWKLAVGTAESALDSNELLYYSQILEGQDLQQLAYGTSSAKSMTLSFWVKAYQAGTYTCSIYKADQTARGVKINYTINASATWEFKTITFPGDTGGGGIDNDNGGGLYVHWVLASGSDFTSSNSMDGSWANYGSSGFAHGQTVNTMSSTDNYWQIVGVQLEVGTQATAFEHRSFGEELALCQRYYYVHLESGNSGKSFMNSNQYNSSASYGHLQFACTMRTNPTLEIASGTNYYGAFGNSTAQYVSDLSTVSTNPNGAELGGSTSSFSSGQSIWWRAHNASSKIAFTADL